MRALGLTDTIFYNLRDAQITAVAALDGPCDLASLVAEVEGVVDAMPGYQETPMRIGVWSFARRSAAPTDVTRHIFVCRDPTVTEPGHLAPLLDRLRQNRVSHEGPPWRMIVLNPAGTSANGRPPVSAVFFQMRHGLGDGMRAIQAMAGMGRYRPTAGHVAEAARLPAFDFAALARNIVVHDTGLMVMQVPRRGMSRETDASTRLAAVAGDALEDATLFPHAHPLRGSIGRTRFVMRRGAAMGVGNYLRMETIARKPRAGRRRLRIPGLARAQELPISQWAVAIAPGPLARLMMQIWYANFDSLATILPLPRRFRLGGRAVTAMFGAPPLWGPVPLVLLAFADGEHYHITVFPGRGFAGDPVALKHRLRTLLTQGMVLPATGQAR